MDGLQLRDEAVQDRIRQAEEFLDPSDQSARSYRADVILMLNRGFRRLTVSLDEIRTHNRQLADGLLQAPFDFSRAFDQALKNTIVALPNRPAREASDDVVSRLSITSCRTVLIANARCTTVPTSAASANSPATLEPSAPPTSIIWYRSKESLRSAPWSAQRW